MGASHTELSGASWIFEEADGWLGFSPSVSRALEEAYQTWLQEDAGGALLPQNFRYLAQFIQDDCPAQRICRVSNNLPPEKCAVHLELKVQHLEAQLSAAGELEQKLKRALDDARSQAPLPLSEAERLVVTLRKALWPGRLVKWRIPDAGEACLVGRILCMSGSEAGVAFADLDDAVWLPCCALEADSQAEVLSRSGSKVFWHGGGRPQKALVQGDGLHPATVRIWSEGVECSVAIQDLTARTPTAHPDLGDVVRQGQSLGLVVQSDDLGICIQSFAGSQEKQPQAFIPTTDVDEALAAGDLELLTLQPGCSVMRGQEVGVLHCRRGEYAIVDFLGEIGWEGPLDHLEPAKEDAAASQFLAAIGELFPKCASEVKLGRRALVCRSSDPLCRNCKDQVGGVFNGVRHIMFAPMIVGSVQDRFLQRGAGFG
ncbi:unnamed protein product [Durusdinium trenchii]|uniref:WWE domain-containing protein n=1 Tax=Durusdinium trenchii TaxID=1381693 RepID=A0ABP0JMZ8_9DINO